MEIAVKRISKIRVVVVVDIENVHRRNLIAVVGPLLVRARILRDASIIFLYDRTLMDYFSVI